MALSHPVVNWFHFQEYFQCTAGRVLKSFGCLKNLTACFSQAFADRMRGGRGDRHNKYRIEGARSKAN